jgi:hypothetical protein
MITPGKAKACSNSGDSLRTVFSISSVFRYHVEDRTEQKSDPVALALAVIVLAEEVSHTYNVWNKLIWWTLLRSENYVLNIELLDISNISRTIGNGYLVYKGENAVFE